MILALDDHIDAVQHLQEMFNRQMKQEQWGRSLLHADRNAN